MKHYFFIIIACVLITQGCVNDSAKMLTEQEIAIITEEVKARIVDYFDALKKLDYERMLDFCANTEGFVVAWNGTLVEGYDKQSIKFKDLIQNTNKVNYFELRNDPHVYVLARDAASYAMEYRMSITMKSGDTLNDEGSGIYVFKKFDDIWQVVHTAGTKVYN